jgi:ubiquinone/menaquinone biosynthesis C-methylase UbiE
MSKKGEKDYLKNLGKNGIEHAFNKPFSDKICGQIIMDIGSIMEFLPKPPARLLDLGCGTGWTSCFFAKQGYTVTGQDISPDMITYANKNKERDKLDNIIFIESDYEKMNYSNEFDCAVFYGSLHHAEDEQAALQNTFNALKPNGILIVFEPGKGHSKAKETIETMEKFDVIDKDMPPTYLVNLAKTIGFKNYEIHPQLSQMFKMVYTRPNKRGIYDLIFNLPFTRAIGSFFMLFFYKYRSGLVILKKG